MGVGGEYDIGYYFTLTINHFSPFTIFHQLLHDNSVLSLELRVRSVVGI